MIRSHHKPAASHAGATDEDQMFDQDRFISDTEFAARNGGQHAVREVVSKAIADPSRLIHVLGQPSHAMATVLHASKHVTIINMIWGPNMTMMPHNHHMWAVIGLYTGREDNILWRTLPPDARWPIEAAGAASLMAGDARDLGADIIHSVTNPLGRLTGALHIYGGDYLHEPREAWDPETLQPEPFNLDVTRRLFADSNRA
jgi:predicted metal-dependent enzyme (double-stranded beta helix superfamily)